MKELQNLIYRHMDSLKYHKRYLAMLTALSMLVTFIVPLILIEPADSMTGTLVCSKVEHTHSADCYVGDVLNCSITEHIHTEDCYRKSSLLSLKGSSETTSHEDNIPVSNAGGGYNEETKTYSSADAHEKVDEDGYYNPATVPLYTLLFGEGANHWVETDKSLDENLQIANQEYFLGFASDFCAFIESDFEAFDADAEGRVFIGGDLIFNGNSEKGEWNYQVGAGDFGHFKHLSLTDEYLGIDNFASGIIGGKVYRLGTLTTGSKETMDYLINNNKYFPPVPDGRDNIARHVSGYDVYFYPEEGVYKRFIVGNVAESLHLDEDYLTHGDKVTKNVPYGTSCNHKYYDLECAYCKENESNISTEITEHSYLREVNELAQFYQYSDVSTILEKTFDTVRARSTNLASIEAIEVTNNNGTLTLDASNIGDAKTAYFKLDDWKKNGTNVKKVIIIVPDDRIKNIGSSEFTKEDTITDLDLNIIVSCDDEIINIEGAETFVKSNVRGTGDGYKISNSDGNYTNNHPLSSNILYNFYNATLVEFPNDDGGNFNGTILAPNAHVKTKEVCPGHLSGALIAKSFYGGLEFGYRPYRGGNDIFGMSSGYEIPIDKLDESNNHLPGAMFAIKEDGKVIGLLESGNKTNFAALPSKIDFSGNTAYRFENVSKNENVEQSYAGESITGEKLVTPVGLTVYSDYNCTTLVDADTPVLGKFYIKTNQKVSLQSINDDGSANDYVYVPPNNNPSGDNVYTVYLNEPVTSFKIKATSEIDTSLSEEVSVNFKPMLLTITSNEFMVGKQIDFKVENPPQGDTIYYQHYANDTILTGNQNNYTTSTKYSYTPLYEGDLELSVKAFVNVDGAYRQIAEAEADTKYIYLSDDNSFSLTPSEPTQNNNVVVNVNSANNGANVYIAVQYPDGTTQSFTGQINNGSYNCNFTASAVGTYSVNVKINDTDIGTKTFEISSNGDSNEATLSLEDENVTQTLFTLNNVNLLSDENVDTTDNKITITAKDGERIDSVKLKITDKSTDSYNNYVYGLKATFYSATDEELGTKDDYQVTTENGVEYINIKASDINATTEIAKIEITPTVGWIQVETCYPTYVKKADMVTKDYSTGFKINKDEEYTIDVEDWAGTLAGITLNLQYNTQNIETGGKLSYTLLGDDDTEIVKDIQVSASGNKIEITGIKAENVKKIKIKALDSYLAVANYSISAYKEIGFDENDIQVNNTIPVEGKYTIFEQQAPVGYFKDESLVYTITVTENITKILPNNNKTYPAEAITIITAKNEETDTEQTLYTIRISYGMNGEEIDPNVRIIEILDNAADKNVIDTFKITKGLGSNDTDVLQSVHHLEGDDYVELTSWDKITPNYYEIGGKSFYFDPISMMIVPVYSNHLTFNNEKGFLFRKVDDKGAAVKDVMIELYRNSEKITDTSVWNWVQGTTSEYLMHLEDIDVSTDSDKVIYRFHESDAGGKYETAEDIYMERISDTEIHYWAGSETKPTDCKVLNLDEDNIIRMENTRITGIKLQLRKTDLDGELIGTTDDFAAFCLHANDGTELLHNIEVKNGQVEFDFSNYDKEDTTYVENGYLKPGTYYLKEIKAPSGYEASMKYFYFNVVKDNDGAYSVTSSEILPGVSVSNEKLGTEDCEVTRFSKEALDSITDQMITNNDVILQFTINTSEAIEVSQTWGNYLFMGTHNDESLSSGKIQVNNANISFNLTARNMLEKIGVTPINDENLIEQFRKLTVFEIGTLNSTKVKDLQFGVISDGTDNDTQTTPDSPTIPTLSIDKNTVIISNAKLGDTMDLRVEKKWEGDAGITEFRKPVEVELKRKEGENGTYETFKPDGQEENYITLDSSNEWKYIWEDLPRYVNGKDETGGKYYYSVEEKTTVTGYTSSIVGSDINEGGTIVITNTVDEVDIPVVKNWEWDTEKYDNVTVPETIKVKLQAKIGETWTDIPGRTLVMTAQNKQGDDTETTQTWAGAFENLPKGYEYRVVEVNVPFGWDVEYGKQEITAEETNVSPISEFIVNNKYEIATGSIAIQKLWENLSGNAALPYSITVDLYRSVIGPSYTETDAPYTDTPNGSDETVDYKQDYARLLQHSLYFYDANMCGTDVAQNSALAWRTNCHTEDEVLGGYHDAGDHVMFGLPQGYTASMLGWSYLEFIKDSSNGYTVNENDKAHYKLILERFYDFFVNSVKYDANGNISYLLVQKGLGKTDHELWCAPENQISREDEMVWSSTSGSNIAAEYAAALALGYLNFNDGSAKYQEYLEVAEKLYEFAGRTTPFKASDSSGEYYADTESEDDRAWAAAWLYEATKSRDGKENATYRDGRSNATDALQWDSVRLAAACAMARETKDWSTVTDYIDKTYINNGYYYIHSWGTARFNAIAQTATLIAAKYNSDKKDTYVNWAVGQMNKILGENNWKDTINGVCNGGTITDTNSAICLVTNFVPKGFNVDTPQAAHHRAASGWDDHEEYKANCGYDDDSYTLIGALAGGPAFISHDDGKQKQMYEYDHDHPLAGHDYIDCLHDYCCNEVAIDYNSGLVGAAAGLYYFKGTGKPSTKIEGVEYGAYGLEKVTGDVESPTNSAVPEAAEADSLSEEDAMALLTAYSLKQTNEVSVLSSEDSTNEKYYPLPEHPFTSDELGANKDGYTYTGNYRNVVEIQVDLSWTGNGGYGMSFLAKSGDKEVHNVSWIDTNSSVKPVDYFKSITFDEPQTITSLQFHNIQLWGDTANFKISAIRLYYEGFFITATQEHISTGDEIELTLDGNARITESSWQVTSEDGGEATITERDGKWYLTGTKAGTVLVKATDSNNESGNITIVIHDMEITGEDEVQEGASITLDKDYVPGEAQSFKWFLNGTEITGNSDEVQWNDDGTLTFTGKSLGERKFELKAYDSNGNEVATAEKTIKIYKLITYTHTSTGDNVLHCQGTNKYYVSLKPIPANARIQSITANLSGDTKISQGVHNIYLNDRDNYVHRNGPNEYTLSGSGSMSWNTALFSEQIPTGVDGSEYAFEIWWSEPQNDVTVTSVDIVYKKYDDKDLTMSYLDANGNPISETELIIRKGESVSFTVTATGGTLGSVKLKGENEEILSSDNGTYTVSPTIAGDYTIEAIMDDFTRTLSLKVNDSITINGDEKMDLGSSQTLTVNNSIGNITWTVEGTEGTDYTVNGNIVTFKNGATFNKSTGEVTASTNGGEFTINATDEYDNSETSITITITERPKVPELPRDVFLESVDKITLTKENNWTIDVLNLPMTDEKGNPYYYYIQESGYRQTENGENSVMSDSAGHYIHSSNAVYMPISYYNNGIAPVENGDPAVAMVANKLTETIQGQMPSTGGEGSEAYYIYGIILMLCGLAGHSVIKLRRGRRS